MPQPTLKPGIYRLDYSSPEIIEYQQAHNIVVQQSTRQWMLVATANVMVKVGTQQALAWVTDLQSGQPLANVDVQFYVVNKNAKPLGSPIKTDGNGLATLNLLAYPEATYYTGISVNAVVSDATNLGIGSNYWAWASGLQPDFFNVSYNPYQPDRTIYLYSDRSMYQPGQPVHFRGVLRGEDGVKYGLLPAKTVNVQVTDDQGAVVYDK
jgi:uncharacterized protein YfaS (alpha-2-macroglobulin family)